MVEGVGFVMILAGVVDRLGDGYGEGILEFVAGLTFVVPSFVRALRERRS